MLIDKKNVVTISLTKIYKTNILAWLQLVCL